MFWRSWKSTTRLKKSESDSRPPAPAWRRASHDLQHELAGICAAEQPHERIIGVLQADLHVLVDAQPPLGHPARDLGAAFGKSRHIIGDQHAGHGGALHQYLPEVAGAEIGRAP